MLEKICNSELSPKFRTAVLNFIDSPQLALFQAQFAGLARSGGPLQDRASQFMNLFAMDGSLDMRTIAAKGLAAALHERTKAVMRQVEIGAIGKGSQDSYEGLRQMRKDSEEADMCAIANAWLAGACRTEFEPRERSFSADEDLLGNGRSSGGAQA